MTGTGAGARVRQEVAAVVLAVLSTVAVIVVLLGGATPTRTVSRPLLDGSGGYAFLHLDPETGLPARFDPCEPIAYVVNPEGAPPGAVEDVHAGFGRLAEATGLSFVYEGSTDEEAAPRREAYQPNRYGDRWAPVLVGWTDLSALASDHPGHVLGLASHTVMTHPRRQDVIVTGTVTLATDGRAIRAGFGLGRRWGNVILHELGHLVGLDHTPEPSEGDRRAAREEIMYADAGYSTGSWGAGDLAGLAHLGRDAGCLRVPDPR